MTKNENHQAEKKNSKALLYYQEQLNYMEKELYKHSYHFRNQYNEICKTMKRVRDGCWIYDNNNNYSYLNVMYYNKWEDLFKKIKCSGKDKWIYFVNSKERGESYVEEMKKNGIDAIFLNKDSRRKRKTLDEYQTYAKIVKDSMFEQQVLVSTSFMDNGINICDPLVKHITIDTENQTEFLQMLGRIRIDSTWYDHHITLYLENKSVERIQKNFNNTIMEDIRFIARFKYLKEKNTYFSLDDDLKVLHTLKDRDIVKNGKFKERYAKYLVEDSITANDEHGREYIIQKYTINKFSLKRIHMITIK